MVKYDLGSLIEQLSDEDPEVRKHAALRLMWLEDARAVEPLLKLLNDESPRVRACAILAIGHYEPKQALQPLLSLLEKDSSDDVRAQCIIALGSIGGDEALNGIIPYISDPSSHVREVACGEFSANMDRRAVSQIMERLDDLEWSVRHAACDVLVTLGVADERIVEAIERLRDEPEAAEFEESMARMNDMMQSMYENPESAEVIAELNGFPSAPADKPRKLSEVMENARESLGETGFKDTPDWKLEGLHNQAKKLVEEQNR